MGSDIKQGRLKIGDEDGNVNGGSEDSSSSVSSPTGGERVKLCCSHGGKILPRPSDGTLKYVGGETRVVAIPRSITFSELMKKINTLFDGECILKYQIASEDLDSLVSVKSDEDIRHFLDEYDRLEREGVSKLRTYLFPLKPITTETQGSIQVHGPHSIEQRFVDAINGIVRPSTITATTADCSSPQSLSPQSKAALNQDTCKDTCNLVTAPQSQMAQFHRVQSSPANLGSQLNLGTIYPNGYIPPHSQFSQWFHPGYQYPSNIAPQDHHLHGHHGYQSPTRVPPSHGPVVGNHNPSYLHPMLRHYPGSGGHSRWAHLEQYATTSRPDGIPRSPG